MMAGVAVRVALLASLMALVAVDDVSANQGLELSIHSELQYRGSGDAYATLTCVFNGHSDSILDANIVRTRTALGSIKLLQVSASSPLNNASDSKIALKAEGALQDNKGSIMMQLPEYLINSFSCVVTYSTMSGESNKTAYAKFGRGEPQIQVTATHQGCVRNMQSDQKYVILNDMRIGKQILCDTKTQGGGWIVIQRRTKGDVSFYRNWDAYQDGFGAFTTDFWLGNKAIHTLTNMIVQEMRIDFWLGREQVYTHYSHVKVADEDSKYRIELGKVSGTAGEQDGSGMSSTNGMAFSTFDRDNDMSGTRECAKERKGGWWYDACTKANFDGVWGVEGSTGMQYYAYPNANTKYVTSMEMKIRARLIDDS